MEWFLNETIKSNKFELLIDWNIFNKDIVLKAAYNFLDRWYFFFKLDKKGNIVLQFTRKVDILQDSKEIIWDFSDELLSVYLRDKLEHDNKDIREKIVWAAIANSLDDNNFVELDTDKKEWENNQIDFDKDIDEILKEIENDPELKIDEEEIERILKEIEEETESEIKEDQSTPWGWKPKITIDKEGVKKAKKQFKNKK